MSDDFAFGKRYSTYVVFNIGCDPSLELSQGDSSNEGSQQMFQWRNKEVIITQSFLLPLLI